MENILRHRVWTPLVRAPALQDLQGWQLSPAGTQDTIILVVWYSDLTAASFFDT